MNRFRPTLVMAILLGALGAYLYFIELPGEEQKQQEEAAAAQLLSISEQEITGLTVTAPFSPDISLKVNADGRWMITAPLQAEAQKQEVHNLVRALVLGKITRTLDEFPGDLKPFGLDKPTLVVTVKSRDKEETIALGDSGPISSTLYARRGSEKKILLTNLAPKDFLNKSLMALRNKDILDFDQTKVERLKLTYPDQELALYRGRKSGKDWWQLRAPIEAGADQTAIKVLLLKIQDLKAIGFIDKGDERDRILNSLTDPNVRITLHIADADREVRLYQPDPSSGEAFARTSPDDPLYRINPILLQDLTKDLFTMREKRLLGLDVDQIALMEIRTPDHRYVLVRQQEGWMLEHHPQAALNGREVNLFVSRVTELPAEFPVKDQPSPTQQFGWDTPSATFMVTDVRGNIHTLVLGTRTGGLVYAKGEGLPGTYQARSDILDQIPGPSDLIQQAEGDMQNSS